MALTFQKGDGEKIYISKLSNNEKSSKANFLLNNKVCSTSCDCFTFKQREDGSYEVGAQSQLPNEIIIPDGYNGKLVTRIKDNGFKGRATIVSVAMGDNITSIGSQAFDDCSSLKTITLSPKITYFPVYAFAKCTGLTEFSIPDKVQSIDNFAFEGCSNLSKIVIPVSVAKIYNAFNGCTRLSKVYYKGSAEQWGAITIFNSTGSNDYLLNATRYYYSESKPQAEGNYWHYVDGDIIEWGNPCENGHTWGQTCTTSNTCSVCGATKDEPLGDHTWGEWEITKVQNCTEAGEKKRVCLVCGEQEIKPCGTPIGHDYGDEEIVITPSCEQPDYTKQECLRCGKKHYVYGEEKAHTWGEWFTETEPTEYIAGVKARICDICGTVETERIPALDTLELTLLEDGTYSVRASTDNISGEIIIPSTYNGKAVTEIADGAFFDCESLSRVEIPNGITYIGKEAFYGCSRLSRLEIPDSVTSINDYAFANCTNLSSVTFGNSVEIFGEYAFFGCEALTSITLPDSVKHINDYVFYDCINLSSITIGNGIKHIGYESGDKVFYNTAYYNDPNNWTDGVLYIGDYLISVKSTVTEVEVASSCSSISAGITSGRTLMAIIKIPLNVANIQPKAFTDSKNLTIYCEATSKPEGWADDWCDDSVTVVWGYSEGGESCSHSYGGWITTALPTCMRFGSMRRTCSSCGNVDIALIDPLEHEYETVVTEPTCLTKGYTDYICKRCGTQLRKDYTSSLGHEWDEGFVRIEPTCTTNGVRRHTCTRCGDTVEVGISALRHDWGEWSHVHSAECEIDGMDSRYCKRCGEEEIQNVPATGHDWDVEVEVVEPTCTDGGYTIHTCNYCGATKRDNYTEPLGHNIVNGICTRCDNDTRGVVYYGVAAIPERYNSAFVLGLDQKVPSNSHLTSISATPLEGEYIYYCVPTSFGDCSFAYNNFVGGFSLIIEGLALTNAGGKTESYNIYKSNQAHLGADGAITITIIGTSG